MQKGKMVSEVIRIKIKIKINWGFWQVMKNCRLPKKYTYMYVTFILFCLDTGNSQRNRCASLIQSKSICAEYKPIICIHAWRIYIYTYVFIYKNTYLLLITRVFALSPLPTAQMIYARVSLSLYHWEKAKTIKNHKTDTERLSTRADINKKKKEKQKNNRYICMYVYVVFR